MTSLVGRKREYVRLDFEGDTNNVKEELQKKRREIEQKLFLDIFDKKTKNVKNKNKVYDIANNFISKPLECYTKSIETANKYQLALTLADTFLPFKSSPLVRLGNTAACLAKEVYNSYFK